MNWPRLALRTLGRRLPKTRGELRIDGPEGPISIRRDRFGVPHIDASSEADAWFAIGFCQGQDRTFQIEVRLRIVRGTLAALVGAEALPLDRLARRMGLRRYGEQVVATLEPRHRRLAEAFAAGATAGATIGLPRRPHEFVLLNFHPTPYEAPDVFALMALQCFALSSNWDAELARLQILRGDGPEAVAALDPRYPPGQPASNRATEPSGGLVDRLGADLAALAGALGLGGGSNNWAVSGSRTATGRPLLANDPHLAPLLPAHWYLLHVTTPEWAAAGAALAASPALAAAHNGRAAWGITAALIDNTDLFLEEIGEDGASVRRGDRFVPCRVRRETIEVKRGTDESFDVLETDRGPVIGPALDGEVGAVSMAATWLQPDPGMGRMFDIPRLQTFDDLRQVFSGWNSIPLNVAFAGADGTIGWQVIGSAPRRRRGGGMVPLPAWEEDTGWEADPVPFRDLPFLTDPEDGFVATANNLPSVSGPYLGSDFLDGYRVQRIVELLAARTDWDVPSTLRMQMDRRSIPWRELRETVLSAISDREDLAEAAAMLGQWDGELQPASPAAALFEAALAHLIRRIVESRAPRSARWALGTGFHPLVPLNVFLVRRVSHLSTLLRDQPEGWFDEGWKAEVAVAVRSAVAALTERFGEDPSAWEWGRVRPLTLKHPMGSSSPLDRVFNLGPVPHGGDANTINPAPVDPADPLGNPDFAIASLRMVVDVGRWELSRFVLAGGQSGNPFSPHYGDLFELWQKGDAVPIPWTEADVEGAARARLVLRPAASG